MQSIEHKIDAEMQGVKTSSYPVRNSPLYRPLVPSIASLRLALETGSPYPRENLLSRVNDRVYQGQPYVTIRHWSPNTDDIVPFEDAIKHLDDGRLVAAGERFGPSFTNHWLKVTLQVPEDGAIFEFDPSCEAHIYDPNGNALQAITGTIRPGPLPQVTTRTEHIIPQGKGTYIMYIEVSCLRLMGNGGDGGDFAFAAPDMDRTFHLAKARIVIPNHSVRALLWDFVVLRQIAESDKNKASSLPLRALKTCNRILDLWDGSERSAREGHDIARKLIGTYKASHATPNTKVWAIGHCHIDTAWLWRYRQAQQKIARSWSTQCDLMRRWPSYQFAASAAQHFDWLETMYPKIFEDVKGHIQKGQFCPVGGSWVEHDCMIPSGESLVRQYLYGQRYFHSRFGSYCREAWLPDTFGYASQLPQILRLAGIDFFYTHKLSWNNITTFPFSTFNWVALDGTQVLAHMSPVGTYNAQCNFAEIQKSIWNHQNLADSDQTLLLFGNGDGGGGPNEQHLEKLDRLSSIAHTQGDVPKIGFAPPAEFFDDICLKTSEGAELPSWQGELYLEFHRGTYTTHSALKQGNRHMEQNLLTCEYLYMLATIVGSKYPKTQLDAIWHDTLLNQFHDVIPGTSIKAATEDALAIYDQRKKELSSLIETAIAAITTPSDDLLIIDPLRIPRQEVVTLNHDYHLIETDSSGFGKTIKTSLAPRAYQDGSKHIVENASVRLVIQDGRIVSLKHLERELIRPSFESSSGGLILYKDLPLRFDAWDAEIYHLDSFEIIDFDNVEIENTSLVSTLIATARFGGSSATIRMSLDAVSSFVRVQGMVDWQEKHKFLKFVLPVDIRASNALYGTQFGVLERPTHRNTPQDQAKFEVCAHMFADLSGPDYGVSVCSATKYGYSIEDNSMRISLMRAPTAPDPETDQGTQHFEFGFLPHPNRFDFSHYQQVQAFTNPPLLRKAQPKEGLPKFDVQGEIVLETIKHGEDGGIVLRLYEPLGSHASGHLSLSNINEKEAKWVDLLERHMAPAVLKNSTIALDFAPFEIKTLLIN